MRSVAEQPTAVEHRAASIRRHVLDESNSAGRGAALGLCGLGSSSHPSVQHPDQVQQDNYHGGNCGCSGYSDEQARRGAGRRVLLRYVRRFCIRILGIGYGLVCGWRVRCGFVCRWFIRYWFVSRRLVWCGFVSGGESDILARSCPACSSNYKRQSRSALWWQEFQTSRLPFAATTAFSQGGLG